MTYTHLTTNELVMIEVHYKEGIKALGRSKQTIYKVIQFLKEGLSIYFILPNCAILNLVHSLRLELV